MSPWAPLLIVCATLALAGDLASDPCDAPSYKQAVQTGDRATVTRFATRCGTDAVRRGRVVQGMLAARAWTWLGDLD
ncbi:MAG TPA: hypothetical protein VK454_11965, partial [Myxococcaceae bacterium]|nr:hypothetical protein [Myxococcaceae bacterium]